jgi:biotin carboxyl carrier protein
MNLTFEHDSGEVALSVERTAGTDGIDTLTVTLPDGATRSIQARRLPGNVLEIAEGNRVFRVPIAHGERGAVYLSWQGQAHSFTPRIAGAKRSGAGGARSGVLTAPMVGVVAAVHVSVGDTVEAYQPVTVVEAMKVLATLEAPFAGIVRAVNVQKGDRVEHGAVLVEISPTNATESPSPQL